MCLECVHAGIAAGAAGLTLWKALPVLVQKLKARHPKETPEAPAPPPVEPTHA